MNEQDERRAMEDAQIRDWLHQQPKVINDYDRPMDEESRAIYESQVRDWLHDAPEIKNPYDYY